MNMAVRIVEDVPGERLPPCAFQRVHKTSVPTAPARSRYLSALVAILAHIALAAAIVWGGSKAYRAMTPEPITVAIIAETPAKTELPPPPQPQMKVPEPAIAIAPEITIATPPPSKAITAQQVQTAAPTSVPSPIAGTGRDAYLARIIAYLDAAKRYPPQARKLHIEGVVQLHFVMDRTGRVLSFGIAKSSGRPILDEETRQLIARAQPLPPIPADWPQQTLNLVVPVEFELH